MEPWLEETTLLDDLAGCVNVENNINVKKIIGEEHSELDFILFFTLELLIDSTLKPKQIHET